MVQFKRKSESRGDKYTRVNSICITKSINLLKIFYGFGVRCDVDIFKLTAHAPSIYREVYNIHLSCIYLIIIGKIHVVQNILIVYKIRIFCYYPSDIIMKYKNETKNPNRLMTKLRTHNIRSHY